MMCHRNVHKDGEICTEDLVAVSLESATDTKMNVRKTHWASTVFSGRTIAVTFRLQTGSLRTFMSVGNLHLLF